MSNNTKINEKSPINKVLSVHLLGLQDFRLNHKRLGCDGAILFQRLVYESYACWIRDPQSHGYYYHSKEDFARELGIGKERFDRIIDWLFSLDVIHAKRLKFPAVTHYSVNFLALTDKVVLNELYRLSDTGLQKKAEDYRAIIDDIDNRRANPTGKEKMPPSDPPARLLYDMRKWYYEHRAWYNREVDKADTGERITLNLGKDTSTLYRLAQDALTFFLDEERCTDAEFDISYQLFFLDLFCKRGGPPPPAMKRFDDSISPIKDYSQTIRHPVAYFLASSTDIYAIATHYAVRAKHYLEEQNKS